VDANGAITNRSLKIMVDGASRPTWSSYRPFEITAANFTMKGLSVADHGGTGNGMIYFTNVAAGGQLVCNHIGVDAAGTAKFTDQIGINVYKGTNVTVGGTSIFDRNIISGSSSQNLRIGTEGTNVIIKGNYIGTDITGMVALPNNTGIQNYGSNTTIGGTGVNDGNLISGNIYGAQTNSGNNFTILGNIIGLGADKLTALPNTTGGLVALNGDGTIGDGTAAGRNVISSSGDFGVLLYGSGNVVLDNNYIGVAADGTTPRGNVQMGIERCR